MLGKLSTHSHSTWSKVLVGMIIFLVGCLATYSFMRPRPTTFVHRPSMPSLCPLPAPGAKIKRAYATVITSSSYKIGAFVLIESVRATGDVATPFLVLYTSKVVFTEVEVSLFKAMGAILRQIEPMKGPTSHLAKARLSNNFTQLRLWQQTDFDVIVFMDADSVVLKNIEHAFGLVTMFPQWQFAAAADSLAAQVETLSGSRREDEVSSFILNAGFEILRPCDATFRDLQALVESQEAEDLQVRYTQWIWEYYWGNYMLILPYTYGGSAFKAERAVPLSQRYHIHYYSSNSKPWETDGQTTDPSCSCIHPSLKVWHEFKDQFLHRANKLGLFYQ